MKSKSMDLNKLRSIIKKKAATTNIVDQVKDDVRVFKNLQLVIIEERKKVAAQLQENFVKLDNK